MRFASARIITADVDRSVAFYERLLGLAPERPAPVFAVFRAETGTLAIGHPSTVPVPGFAAAHDGALVEFLETSPAAVDAVHARLADGVEVVQPPTDMPWGNRSLLLRDPDGVLVNVYAPLR
ncbi:VOC family protein [Amnibacterium kyonggiense]|uniref:Putative enzyme related to lactoylglutathione lyase n=1 Tax=Amnibacterium kyonggiense TaxID=595671 RepID=A0A4R7FSA3_9MICO|nr:VOC family protein [Amnibacterium kyonggiense]TDS80618.1 putative enzyme related to lactoylglutathione lyase [Amnibacterium kyonggiense]